MSGLADDLVAYLDTNSTKVTAATNLFKHAIVETTGRAVFVIETMGAPNIEKFSGSLPAMIRPRASITVRSTASVGGAGIAGSTGTRDLAGDMWDLLVGVANTSVNSKTYQRVECLQTPFFLRRDEKGRAHIVFNVQAMASPTTQA